MPQLPDAWPFSTSPFKPRDSKDNPPADSVGIVIPMKDGLKFFKLCFHSVLSFTDYQHMLAVIDNQSTFPTKTYLASIAKNHNLSVLRYDDDFNFAAEVNLGIRHLFQWPTVRYGLILNADAVVSPNWLSDLVRTINSNPRIGIVGPMSNKARIGTYTAALRVSGFCMLFRREVFEELDGFDESFLGGGFEDWDFCERAKRKNWHVIIDGNVHIHHFYRMFRRENHRDSMDANQHRFFEKHPILRDAVTKVGA
jgi:GT2 family glycosyltransferase